MILGDFKGKKVGLLGAGLENLGTIPTLLKNGALITVCEQWEKSVSEEFRAQYPAVKYRFGEDHLKNIDEFDVVIRAPGLPIKRVDKALTGKSNQPIRTSASDLFLANKPCRVIGVTGTKGKGTTSTLITSLLRAGNYNAILAGNIGASIFDFFDELKKDDVVVLELSSFQLEDVTHSPDIAVMLPITEDHLQPLSETSPNYHETLEDYAAAKGNITAFQEPQDLLVFAQDSLVTSDIARQSMARKIGVGTTSTVDINVTAEGKLFSAGEELIDLQETGLRGEHIFLDAALAVVVAREFEVTADEMMKGLTNYQPLPHRLEKIAEIKNISYYDDSYATAPDAAIAAIKSFSEPLIWIGGGSSKGADFAQLAKTLKSATIRTIILLGEEGPRIVEALRQVGYAGPVKNAQSMTNVVELANAVARPGDVVLLSPACASKDMFVSAADRGEQFRQLVQGGMNGGQV